MIAGLDGSVADLLNPFKVISYREHRHIAMAQAHPGREQTRRKTKENHL